MPSANNRNAVVGATPMFDLNQTLNITYTDLELRNNMSNLSQTARIDYPCYPRLEKKMNTPSVAVVAGACANI